MRRKKPVYKDRTTRYLKPVIVYLPHGEIAKHELMCANKPMDLSTAFATTIVGKDKLESMINLINSCEDTVVTEHIQEWVVRILKDVARSGITIYDLLIILLDLDLKTVDICRTIAALINASSIEYKNGRLFYKSYTGYRSMITTFKGTQVKKSTKHNIGKLNLKSVANKLKKGD